jgi:hypothetical protein
MQIDGVLSPLPGLYFILGWNPALTRWGTFCRPSGPVAKAFERWVDSLMVGHDQMDYCDYSAEKGLAGTVKEPQRGVSSQPGASPREHRATMKMSPERAA